MPQVTIKVDDRNKSTTWWESARERSPSEVPRSCWSLFAAGRGIVMVSAEDAAVFKAWAETLPGWNDGKEFAPHPFTFRDALSRAEAEEKLAAFDWLTPVHVQCALDRAGEMDLGELPWYFPEKQRERAEATRAVLRAHVAYLDAQR